MLKSKIKSRYEKHSCERVCQGDILRDFKFKVVKEEGNLLEIFFPYIIVLSQDCDLQYGLNPRQQTAENTNNPPQFNQFLPNILFSPAFPADLAKEGNHLKESFNILQEKKDKETWKLIKQNKNERYHFLSAHPNYQIPELVIDFKNYYTLPKDYFVSMYHDCYLATLNELYRENLSQRFSNYLNRIGLPEFANEYPRVQV